MWAIRHQRGAHCLQILTYGSASVFPSELHKSQAGEGAQRARQAWPGNRLKAGRRLSCTSKVPSLYYLHSFPTHQPQFYLPEIDFFF